MILKLHKLMILILLISIFLTGCFTTNEPVEVTDTIAEKALEIALDYQGKPYQWGGRGPDSFDCSGLITWSYKKAVGKDEIFRISNYVFDDAAMNDLYTWNITLIPLEVITAGDILFFTDTQGEITHGGLFVKWLDKDNFKFIHASFSQGKVVLDTWPVAEVVSGQWLVGAGRFIIN